jgi:dihydroflavonol-4-reductase
MDSKYNAYLEAMAAFKTKGMPVITVHPTFMLGPFDSKPSSGALIMEVFKKKAFAYTNGGKNVIHVRDAANAIVNALEQGRLGESYILGNQNLSYKEIFNLVSSIVGVPKPKFGLPRNLTLAYGLANNFLHWATSKHVAINYAMCKISCDEHYYSAEKAVSEIGLRQSPIDMAVKESFDWMKTNLVI